MSGLANHPTSLRLPLLEASMSVPDIPTSTHVARHIDPTGLQGEWINTESSPRALARILIERRSDAIALRVEGRTNEAVEWFFESRAFYASSSAGGDAVAFVAERDVDSMPVELHANVSKGLLIVSSFQTRLLADGPERRFAREFFRRTDPEFPGPADGSVKQSAVRPLSSSSAASTFGGSWRNTNTTGSGIASVSFALTDVGGTLCVQRRNRSDANDWGTATVEIYNEIGAVSEPAKIKASYDLGSMDVQLHGWVKQGVLVLALFRRFKEATGEWSYFDREFFYRTRRHTDSDW
jgi:hypothetical protein